MSDLPDNTPSYFAIIPANVRYCMEIEPNAKLLYGELTALASKEGYCWASNRYLASLYSVEIRTVQNWLESLKNQGFIEVEYIQNGIKQERKIWISKEVFTARKKCHDGENSKKEYSAKESLGGGAKIDSNSNTSSTTSLKEERENTDDLSFFPSDPEKEKIQEEEVSSKLQLLKRLNLEDSFVQVLIAYPQDQIQDGINASLQWREKRASEGQPLECLGSAIVRAVIAKWKPSKSKEDIEGEAQLEKERQKNNMLSRLMEARELENTHTQYLPYEFSFKVSENMVTLRVGKAFCPIDLNEENSIEILKDHIKRYAK